MCATLPIKICVDDVKCFVTVVPSKKCVITIGVINRGIDSSKNLRANGVKVLEEVMVNYSSDARPLSDPYVCQLSFTIAI